MGELHPRSQRLASVWQVTDSGWQCRPEFCSEPRSVGRKCVESHMVQRLRVTVDFGRKIAGSYSAFRHLLTQQTKFERPIEGANQKKQHE